MFNDRPIKNPNILEVMARFDSLLGYFDLTGCCQVADFNEWAFTYHMDSTWNAVVKDMTLPLGFRIRAKESELGRERLEELLSGTGHTIGGMLDFGSQTQLWMRDLFTILRKSGLRIDHNPFGGANIPRLISKDMR